MKKSDAYALITVFLWATLAAVTKMLLADIPNFQALSLSGGLAGLFLLLINLKSKKLRLLKSFSLKDYLTMAGLGALGLFAYSALYFYGLTQLSSQEACIINYLWPIMLVVFSSLILKEKMTKMKVVAILCSFVGIVILSAGSFGTGQGNVLLGMACCAVAAVCYGLYCVWNKQCDYDQNIAMMIGWLVVALCSGVLSLLTEQWVIIRPVQWAGLLWLGMVVNAVAYLLWALAMQETDNTAKIANFAYMTPFLSLIVSAILLKEQITARAFLALIFIIGGVLLQSLSANGKK